MATVIYSVPSIHCNHCVQTIQMELMEIEGILSVQVDGPSKEVLIQYDLPATPESIEKLMAEINFPVEKQ